MKARTTDRCETAKPGRFSAAQLPDHGHGLAIQEVVEAFDDDRDPGREGLTLDPPQISMALEDVDRVQAGCSVLNGIDGVPTLHHGDRIHRNVVASRSGAELQAHGHEVARAQKPLG